MKISAIINTITLTLVISYFQLIVHELGHAVVGLVNGMKVKSFSVMPFKFTKQNGKWKIQIERKSKSIGSVRMEIPWIINKNNYDRTKLKLIFLQAGGHLLELLGLFVWHEVWMAFHDGGTSFIYYVPFIFFLLFTLILGSYDLLWILRCLIVQRCNHYELLAMYYLSGERLDKSEINSRIVKVSKRLINDKKQKGVVKLYYVKLYLRLNQTGQVHTLTEREKNMIFKIIHEKNDVKTIYNEQRLDEIEAIQRLYEQTCVQ